MIAALDVHYEDPRARAAAVLFRDWTDAVAARELVAEVEGVAPYVPGRFFERELPPLLAVLKLCDPLPDVLVVDGYVDLPGGPGLGRHLHEATGRPVVGVAKTEFRGAPSIAIARGRSRAYLYVSAAGTRVDDAAYHVLCMHGIHRVPALLKRVDRLARGLDGVALRQSVD